ncbi:MAG: hypothetical protein ACH346_03025 [Chthoniobacterales bacterium]
MKRAALILTSIFIIGALVVFFLLHRLGPTSSSRLVPANTLALVDFPDLASTSQRWGQSLFAKIAAEPEIKGFLERPLDRFHQLTSSPTSDESLEKLLVKIKPGRFFAALEAYEEEHAWIMGCQIFGNSDDAEKGFVRLHQFLDAHFGAGEKTTLDSKENQGEVITQSSHGDLVVYSASRGNWFFVSNSIQAVKKSLDFLAGRCSQKESLAATNLYQKNRAELLSEADFFCYVRPSEALEIFPSIKAAFQNNDTVMASQSVGVSFRLTDEGMKERLFFSGNFPKGASLVHNGLRLTQPTTLAYIERTNEWNRVFDILQNNKSLPPAFVQMLSPAGIDLSSLAGLLKPQTVMVLDWLEGHSFPEGFIAIPTDEAKANSWLQQVTMRLGMMLQTDDKKEMHFISTPQLADGLKPTMAIMRGDFFLGTDPTVIEKATQNILHTTLKTSPGFAKADDFYHQANEIFAYFSTKELFERSYEAVRPGLLLGGSFMSGVSTTVDFSKLPSTATIAHYLLPIIYAQSHVAGGILVQSSGPLTGTPLFFLGNALYTFLQEKKKGVAPSVAPVPPNVPATGAQ